MFHLSAKDFASPLGVLPGDTGFITTLANRFGVGRAFADEYLHKKEHSLELQLPFISAVRPGISIVPILVGSFHAAVSAGKPPREYEEYETFVGSLVETIRNAEAEGRKVCFIAGVDMAHVGSFFGDEWSLSPERMEAIAERDKRYLDAIAAYSCDELFAHIAEDGDARRICGFPTMHTILDTLQRLSRPGSCYVRSYQQAVDYPSGCAVTFAGLALGA
jgi:AmmeMemoRadiSam system protein B